MWWKIELRAFVIKKWVEDFWATYRYPLIKSDISNQIKSNIYYIPGRWQNQIRKYNHHNNNTSPLGKRIWLASFHENSLETQGGVCKKKYNF